MVPEKISKRFRDIEIIPGNGYSPHTGCLVFICYDTVLGRAVTVKASDGIKNKHATVLEEYEFIKSIDHPGVIKVRDYHEEDGVQYMVMHRWWPGGRRTRWRTIFLSFTEGMARHFMRSLMDTLFFLQENNILHEDIECANMLYNNVDVAPILIDFGRASYKKYSKEWLLDQLRLDKKTKQNAFFREITNTGGVYTTEPKHFNFDIKPIIKQVVYGQK